MKTLLTCFLMSWTLFSMAQKKKKPSAPEIRTFRMPKFPNADFPKKSIPVSEIRVVQVLNDSVRFGYAMKGLEGEIVILVPEKPPTIFLQNHIDKMYKNDLKEDGFKILWVVKELRVGEKSGFMEYAYTRFNTDAYISKDGALYTKLCSIDTVFVTESGSDVTAWHGEDIENAFKLLLKRTLKAGKETLWQDSSGLSIAQIKERSSPGADFPIMNNDVYKEGAYASFEEFLQNNPSYTKLRMVSVVKKRIKFLAPDSNGQMDTVKIWGLCKDGEIYKCENETLVAIEKQGKGFIISNYVEQANRRNSNVFFTSFLAGAVGGLVGGVGAALANSGSGGMLLVKSIPYISKAKQQPEASCIDMKTGELSF